MLDDDCEEGEIIDDDENDDTSPTNMSTTLTPLTPNSNAPKSRSRERRSPSRERRRRERRERSRERRRRERRERSRERKMREQSNQRSTEMVAQPCKFFQEGDCKKGDNCNFLHETPNCNQKKRDICKFYLQGFCGKGDHCNFMHEEFPCKFFHTGAECYGGEKCRFSHAPLTEETRGLLRNYLDSGELPDDHLRKKETSPTTSYPPNKPSVKRHAVLGDVTDAIKTSYDTWTWQKEMKELELAYTGNKRNLFEIEDEFVVTEKPPTPPPPPPEIDAFMDDDPDERECKIMSYYIDTMGSLPTSDTDCRVPPVLPSVPIQPTVQDDDLLLFSAHDEDLRILPPVQPVESQESLSQDGQQVLQTGSVTVDETAAPWNQGPFAEAKEPAPWNQGPFAEAKEPAPWNQGPFAEAKEPAPWDQGPFAMAKEPDLLPQVKEEEPVSSGETRPKYDIVKMLNVIRQTTSQMAPTTVPQQQSEFWQNIFSGARLTSPVHSSPQKDQTRDPRLKSAKDKDRRNSSPRKGSDHSSRESGSESEKESSDFRLVPVSTPEVNYSCYIHLYRSDSKLKNDPRLQKFFNKLPTSVVDHLSKLLPSGTSSNSKLTNQSTITSSTLASLMAPTSPSKSLKRKSSLTTTPDGQILPILPPLTLTEPKTTTLNMFPPLPPIMSPIELMASSPKRTKMENGELFSKSARLESAGLESAGLESARLESAGLESARLESAGLESGTQSAIEEPLLDLSKSMTEVTVPDTKSDLSVDVEAEKLDLGIDQEMDHEDEPTEERTESPNLDIALTMSSDTPASPSSRRSSCDVYSPPLVTPEDLKEPERDSPVKSDDLAPSSSAVDPV